MKKDERLTTGFGMPVDNDLDSVTAEPKGPVIIQDAHLIEKLAHFDRERIPERVVHAKGAGAYGYFEVTDDVTRYTRAKFLSEIGKRTESAEEGNYDMVGNNTPVSSRCEEQGEQR